MNGKQKRVQTMVQLSHKSKDYDKFTRELQLALEKEVIRRQTANNTEDDEKSELGRSIDWKNQIKSNEHQSKPDVIEETRQHEDSPTEKKKPKTKSIFRKVDVFMSPALLSKTAACKHDHGCFENVIRRAFRNFLIGFGI